MVLGDIGRDYVDPLFPPAKAASFLREREKRQRA
jgi:hypothetical protein